MLKISPSVNQSYEAIHSFAVNYFEKDTCRNISKNEIHISEYKTRINANLTFLIDEYLQSPKGLFFSNLYDLRSIWDVW